MALLHRAQQTNAAPNPPLPDIPAPATPNADISGGAFAVAGPTGSLASSILAAVPLTTNTASTPTSMIPLIQAPTSPGSTSPSATPSPGTGVSAGKIAAIVVPIVALILLIPLLFLLYRGHQLKKAAQNRESQRLSQEAMLQRQASTGMVEALPRMKGRSKGPTPRPANSLGLFNFDLSRPQSTNDISPISGRGEGIATFLGFGKRRSEVSMLDRPPTRQSTEIPSSNHRLDQPPPYSQKSRPDSQEAPAHFAPLNRIGTAHVPGTQKPRSRTSPARGPSPMGQRGMAPHPSDFGPQYPQGPHYPHVPPRAHPPGPREEYLQGPRPQIRRPPDAYSRAPTRKPVPGPPRHVAQVMDPESRMRMPPPGYLPMPYTPLNGVDLGDRFTVSDYTLDDPPRPGLRIDPTWGSPQQHGPPAWVHYASPYVSPIDRNDSGGTRPHHIL